MAFMLYDTPLYAESWNVAFRRKPQGAILTDLDTPFTVIPNNLRYWAADPMVFTHEGHTYIFAELYDYILRRGIIGVTEYLGDGRFGKWQPIIREDFHMSYPYVFRSGDEIYMVPETIQRRALLLYRAVEFPLRWELHKVIRENVRWADTSILPDGDGFSGITQSYNQDGVHDLAIQLDGNFDLRSAERIGGSDPVTGRPGGRPFFCRDTWYRVHQDCRRGYGKALFFRSDREEHHITPDALRLSKPILRDGMHTYSATEEFEVIDLKIRRLNLLNLVMRLVGKLRR